MDAAWYYPDPYPLHASKHHIAFWSDVQITISTRVYSVASDELDLAKQLIDKSTLTIDLSAYKDDY